MVGKYHRCAGSVFAPLVLGEGGGGEGGVGGERRWGGRDAAAGDWMTAVGELGPETVEDEAFWDGALDGGRVGGAVRRGPGQGENVVAEGTNGQDWNRSEIEEQKGQGDREDRETEGGQRKQRLPRLHLPRTTQASCAFVMLHLERTLVIAQIYEASSTALRIIR